MTRQSGKILEEARQKLAEQKRQDEIEQKKAANKVKTGIAENQSGRVSVMDAQTWASRKKTSEKISSKPPVENKPAWGGAKALTKSLSNNAITTKEPEKSRKPSQSTIRPQTALNSTIHQKKSGNDPVEDLVIPKNFTRAALENFPKNGLEYAGKKTPTRDRETLYKKNLTKLLSQDLSTENFTQSLQLKLSGIMPILNNPNAPSPKNPFTLDYSGYDTNLKFIQGVVPVKRVASFSKKIIELLKVVENVNNPTELMAAINSANRKNSTPLAPLLDNFFERNSPNINAHNFAQNITPFVFFKYALQAELFLIARQLSVLEGVSQPHSRNPIPNILFLERNNQDNKDKMFGVMQKKYTDLVLPTYHEKVAHPITAATAQFSQLRLTGTMNIALKNPSTRSFESLQGYLENFDEDEEHGILSEEQHDTVQSMRESFLKGNLDKKASGQGRMRIRTGGGKTHVLKLMAGDKINLDLNSSLQDLEDLENNPNLIGNSVYADELFFYNLPPLRKNEGSERISYARTEGKVIDNEGESSPTEIARRQYDFVYNLRQKRAFVVTVGASESLTKIGYECDRIENKIEAQAKELSELGNKSLIKKANAFIYSLNGGKRESQPILSNIISPNDVPTSAKESASFWNQPAISPTLTKKRPTPVTKTILKHGIPNTSVMSQKELLITTAWHLVKLGDFSKAARDNIPFQQLCAALAPIQPAKETKIDWLSEENGLNNLLKIARIIPATASLRSAKMAPNQVLYKAVINFIEAKSSDNISLLGSLPSDSKQPATQTNTNLDKLKEKLKTRKLQYENLRERRDVITIERLEGTKLFLDNEVENSERSLSDTVLNTLSNLPKPEKSEKIQYILPDFEINEKTCNKKDLLQILNLGLAQIILLPHKKEDGELRCQVACFGDKEEEGVFLETLDIDGLNKIMEGEKSVISFFDRSNAIGGDYGNASVNIAKQVIHLTKTDCLRGFRALDANHYMQYNRDRTDPDDTSEDIALQLILPAAALEKEGITNIPEQNMMPPELVNLVKNNTKISDKFHLDGYLQSKQVRIYGEDYLPPKTVVASTPSRKVNFNELVASAEKVAKKTIKRHTQESQKVLVGLVDRIRALEAKKDENSDLPTDESPDQETISKFTDLENLLTQDAETDLAQLKEGGSEEGEFNEMEEEVPLVLNNKTAEEKEALELERLNRFKLFLTPSPQDENLSSSLFATIKPILQSKSSGFEHGSNLQYILPNFNIDETNCNDEDLANIFNLTKSDLIILPRQQDGKLTYRLYYPADDLEEEDYALEENGEKRMNFSDIDAEQIEEALSQIVGKNPNTIVIRFFDKKNTLGDSYKDAGIGVSKQYIHLTQDDCLESLKRENFDQYDRRVGIAGQLVPEEMDLKLIMPSSAINALEKDHEVTIEIPDNNVMPPELVNFIYTGSPIINEISDTVSEHGDEEEDKMTLDTSRTNTPRRNTSLNHQKNVESLPAPSTSTNIANATKLTTLYKSHPKTDSYWHGSNVNVNFRVLSAAYLGVDSNSKKTPNEEEIKEEKEREINSTLVGIIIHSAIITTPEPLNIEEVVRVLEISRIYGSLSKAFEEKWENLKEDDYKNRSKYKNFSKKFQSECAECGIYLNDLNTSNPNTTQETKAFFIGMRTSNIPPNVDTNISKIKDNILKNSLDLTNFHEESLRRINPKKELVTKILQEADQFKSRPNNYDRVIT